MADGVPKNRAIAGARVNRGKLVRHGPVIGSNEQTAKNNFALVGGTKAGRDVPIAPFQLFEKWKIRRRDGYIYPKVCRFCANFSKRHRTAALRAAAATAIERISGYLDVCCAIEAAAARRAAVLWFRLRRPGDIAPYLWQARGDTRAPGLQEQFAQK